MVESFIKIEEVARILCTTTPNVRNLCLDKKKGLNNFPYYKITGVGIRFLQSEILAWRDGQKVLSKLEIFEREEERGNNNLLYLMVG